MRHVVFLRGYKISEMAKKHTSFTQVQILMFKKTLVKVLTTLFHYSKEV